jgi:hypothetical protein
MDTIDAFPESARAEYPWLRLASVRNLHVGRCSVHTGTNFGIRRCTFVLRGYVWATILLGFSWGAICFSGSSRLGFVGASCFGSSA